MARYDPCVCVCVCVCSSVCTAYKLVWFPPMAYQLSNSLGENKSSPRGWGAPPFSLPLNAALVWLIGPASLTARVAQVV